MSDDTQRVIGEHDAHIDQLRKDMRETRDAVARIEKQLATAQGGVRMLIAVGSIGGAIGAGLVKLWATLKGGA